MAELLNIDYSALYPAILELLSTCGLSKTVKAFRKETELDRILEETNAELQAIQQSEEALPNGTHLEQRKKKRQRTNDAAGSTGAPCGEAGVASSPSSDSHVVKTTKKNKLKTALQGDETTNGIQKTVELQDSTSVQTSLAPSKEGKKKPNIPFKRIDDNQWVQKIDHEKLRNNSFENKGGDNFAQRAADELGRVRGKDFRHEKSKKKRSSWKGIGAIDTGVNSIMFEDSE